MVEAGASIFLSTDKKRLDPPVLSMDLIYSEALFSIIKASSSSLTISDILGRKVAKGSVHAKAASTTLHIDSEWY